MEYSKFWQNEAFEGIGLLKASFQQFEFSKHWHDELSIGIIEKGAEGLNYRGNSFTIPENQIVAINPSEVHTCFSGCTLGWTYRMFYFDPKVIEHYFSYSKHRISPLINSPVIDDPQLFQLLHQLHISFEKPSLDISKETLLILSFETLFSRHGVDDFQKSDVFKDKNNNMTVRDYLQDNWQGNVTLSDLEELSGRSKFQLIRSFNHQYGLTPHQFLLLVKINRAKELLLAGSSCADTALSCGFFDQSHLTRNFKRAFGVSPKRCTRL